MYRHYLPGALLLTLLLLTPSCSSVITGNGNQQGSINPANELKPGTIVAKAKLQAPQANAFTLRFTMPIPPSTFPRQDGKQPFVVVDGDGALVAAQTIGVTRYADNDTGYDVVELIARAHRPAGKNPGENVYYSVMFSPFDAALPAAGNTARAVLLSAPGLSSALRQDILQNAASITLRAHDVFGNEYTARPLADDAQFKITKRGAVSTEVRTVTSLLPDPSRPLCKNQPGPGCALEHMMMVHAYFRVNAGDDALLVDFRFSNGNSNRDGSSVQDNPVGKYFFDQLELLMPKQWTAQQDVEDLYFGDLDTSNVDYNRVPIVRRINEVRPGDPAGTLHMMHIYAQFNRRLALSKTDALATTAARALLEDEGWGAVAAGSGDDGREFWSWWNRDTARYFPQRQVLPNLSHVGDDTMRHQLLEIGEPGDAQEMSLNLLKDVLQTGRKETGFEVLSTPQLGWAHPFGIADGLEPGGTQLVYYEGVTTAASALHLGYLRLKVLHRMNTERQHNVVFNANGEPITHDEWLFGTAPSQYQRINMFAITQADTNPNPYGYDTVNLFQLNYVMNTGVYPYYHNGNPNGISRDADGNGVNDYDQYPLDYFPSTNYRGFQPHWSSHWMRYVRFPMALVWLGNDSLAKDDLFMQTEIGHISYTPYTLSGGYVSGVSMRADLNEVAGSPNRAFSFDRVRGWTLFLGSAYYSMADLNWRHQAKQSWFDLFPDMLESGQCECPSGLSCTGLIQRTDSSQLVWKAPPICDPPNGVPCPPPYIGALSFQNSIVANGIQALNSSVYRGFNASRVTQLSTIVRKLSYALMSETIWPASASGPWSNLAIAAPNGTPFCDGTVPPGGIGGFQDHYYTFNTFALGLQNSGDNFFLTKASSMLGGPVRTQLEASGTLDIGMKAALLAEAQASN